MPTRESILNHLAEVTNDNRALALGWHLAVLLAVLGLILGWRPSRRLAGFLLALPLASAAALAGLNHNPFNAVVLGATALTLLLFARRLSRQRVTTAPWWAGLIGTTLIALALIYPEFVRTEETWQFALLAPTGLIPCPSLALSLGFAITAGGLGARGWSLILAAAAFFYGVVGSLFLGVRLDIVLVAGAAVLTVMALRHPMAVRGGQRAGARRSLSSGEALS